MPQHEVVTKLIKAADFPAATDELERRGIFYFAFQKRHQSNEGHYYRILCFFPEEKDTVLKALADLAIKVFKHPQIESRTYSYGEIYSIAFRETADDILEKISLPDSRFNKKYRQIAPNVRRFLTRMKHASEILGNEFLEVEHDFQQKVKDVKAKMMAFLLRGPIR
jgi:hypothetical protein